MTIHELVFYRKTIQGWEFAYNKLFLTEFKAKKLLRLLGYRLMEDEENLYSSRETRAVLVEREIE